MIIVPQFTGPRRCELHDRQAAIWRMWAERHDHDVRFMDARASHSATFRAAAFELWRQIEDKDEGCGIFEEDFLPYPTWKGPNAVDPPAVPHYLVRELATGNDRTLPYAGLWFIMGRAAAIVNKATLGAFEPGGPYNDPGYQLGERYMVKHQNRQGRWCARYKGMGTHCFFSRHYSDPDGQILFTCGGKDVTTGEVKRAARLETERVEKMYRQVKPSKK